MSRDDVFALFLESRIAAGCSPATIQWYKFFFKRFGDWLEANNHTYNTVKLIHLQQFQASLRKNYAPSTVHQATAAIITFYRWLKLVELITVDPTLNLSRPRVPDTSPTPVTREYAKELIDSIKIYSWVDHRDRLIVRILFTAGVRLDECANLMIKDIDLNRRRISILGKGSKHRYVPLASDTLRAVADWLDHQRPPSELPQLFLSSSAGARVRDSLHKETIYHILKRREEEAGLDWRSPHDFRRGFACDLMLLGASTRLVQILLGHSSVQVTERYLRLSLESVHQLYDDLWREL